MKVWKTKPIFSRRRVEVCEESRREVSVPAMRMRPLVGLSMQPMRFSRVDLPLPLGPEMARNSPAWIWRLTLSRAVTALWSRGNLRVTFPERCCALERKIAGGGLDCAAIRMKG